MYTFEITNENGLSDNYEHIIKASYDKPSANGLKIVVVENEDIFEHRYPTSHDLHLYSESEAYTISKNIISRIKITREK